ncbi:MAG: ornithine cyclodeaminase family protein [Paracoccaceae bacterium]
MSVPFISFQDGDAVMDWLALTDALAAGHALPKAQIGDTFLNRDPDTLLSRSAWIDGLGSAVKTATIFPQNPSQNKPMIHGSVTLFDDAYGMPEAFLDFHLVTKWKTAGDSLLAARRLARPDSRNILIVGAGTVGENLYHAYRAAFPDASFMIWNRTYERAAAFADRLEARAVQDLETAVGHADIVTSATMSTDPVLRGAWIQPGTHVDLIGAYRPDMREMDDAGLQKANVFVDSFDTTLDHIGEMKIPLDSGAIVNADVIADYYNLDAFQRTSDTQITLFKNGGGAHLDLMTARFVLARWQATQ